MHTLTHDRRGLLPAVARKVGMRSCPDHRLFAVLTLTEGTLRLLQELLAYIEIDVVIALPGGARPQPAGALRARGVRVLTPEPEDLDAVVRSQLEASAARSARDGTRVMVVEDGGHAAHHLHRHYLRHALRHFAGCVEVSDAGVSRAREIEDLALPHVNVAVSPLRRVEALVAGDAVALAADALLRAQGWTLAGRRVLVAGYGPVGRGTARALLRRDAVVGVYDPDPLRLVEAKVEGFLTPALREWIPQVSLMVGAAGALSVTAGVIALLPDGAAIAAGGPGGEIDLAALHARAEDSEVVAEGVRRFRMRDGRALLLLGEGAPLALPGGSTPGEVAELGHAEVLLLVHELATREHPAGVASIDPALSAIPAQAWLEARDPHFRALAAAA